MSVGSASAILDTVRLIAPALSKSLYKGQCGRIAVFGGSIEYTGAPYYSAISALKAGCDLSYVVCASEAAVAIKSYSPELIVYPTLYNRDSLPETLDSLVPRLHAAVVGPGFGRSDAGFDAFKTVVNRLKSSNLPFIIDADGLYFVTKDVSLIKNYGSVVLTPNVVEFDRLFAAAQCENGKNAEKIETLCKALGNVVIVQKGHLDLISNGEKTLKCEESSSARRCGGQGDLLSGFLGTFTHWAIDSLKNKGHEIRLLEEYGPLLIAAYAACSLTKQCNRLAFEKFGRSCTTEDMILCTHLAVKNTFG